MSQRLILIMYRLVLLGSVWLVLTGADTKGLAVGAVAVPAATWLSLRLMPARRPVHVAPCAASAVLRGRIGAGRV
ncbi:MAG: hypothetical protein U5K36_05015 [Roseovarius sp.]|nr:hypothetical protein [Roseovarius sp.]